MANKFIKYTIARKDEESGLMLCFRNIIFATKAPEGYYFKSKSGKILGNVVFLYDNRFCDYTGEFNPQLRSEPEEDYELVKEDE